MNLLIGLMDDSIVMASEGSIFKELLPVVYTSKLLLIVMSQRFHLGPRNLSFVQSVKGVIECIG